MAKASYRRPSSRRITVKRKGGSTITKTVRVNAGNVKASKRRK